MLDVSSIVLSSKYLTFKNENLNTIKNDIFVQQTKKPNTEYEEKIQRVIHNFVQPTSIEHKLKNMIILEFNPRYQLYSKLYKQFLDRYGFYLSEYELQELLSSYHPELSYYINVNKNTSSVIDDYTKKIKQIVDLSSSVLNIGSIENYYTSYEYDVDENNILILDKLLRITESSIYLDVIYILQIQNLKYSIERRLTEMNLFLSTHYWNQITIHLCYEITKTEPIFYNDEQRNSYMIIKNKLSRLSDFIDELKFLYKKQKITLGNYVYLLFMKYYAIEIQTKTNIHHLNRDEYIQKVIGDIELYDSELYSDINLSDETIKNNFIDSLGILFDNMKPFLTFPLRHDLLKSIAESFLGKDLSFRSYDQYVNFDVPYNIILENMMNLNHNHLYEINSLLPLRMRRDIYSIQDIFLDIRSWKEIPNFSFEIYFDHLFLNFDLSIVHKYILAMKGILYFQIRDEILKYINRNRSYLIGESYKIIDGKRYKNLVEIKTLWNNDIIASLLNQSENVFIYDIVKVQCENLYQFVDFVIYYLISTRNTPTFENVLNRIQNYTSFTSDEIVDIQHIFHYISKYVPEYNNVKKQSMIKNNNTISLGVNMSSSGGFESIHRLNDVYSLVLGDVILFNGHLFTPSNDFYNFILDDVFRRNENGVDGEIRKGLGLTGGTGATGTNIRNSSSILQNLIRESKIFTSMNFDKESFDHVILRSDLTLTSKLIYSIYNKPRSISDLSNNFGIHISNYIVSRKMDDRIFGDIYNMRDKVTPFALLYFLIEYSIGLSLKTNAIGKAYIFDIVSNIKLNDDDYLDRFKSKITSVHPNLSEYIEKNRSVALNVITMPIYDKIFLDYFKTPEVYEFYDLYEKNKEKNKQLITKLNYTYFIEQFIEQDIKNPYDVLMFVSQFDYGENITGVIRETIKKNYSQYLGKYFYYDWVYSYKNENDEFNEIVFYTLARLMEYGIMSEDEYFDLMSMNPSDTFTLFILMKVYYTFTKDPNEYYVKSGDVQTQIPKLNASSKIENINDIVNSMNFDNMRIPTQQMMKKLVEKTPDMDIRRTQEEIQKELDSLPKEDLKNTVDTPENNEELERKYIESGDVQSMHEYMKQQAQKRGFTLNRWLNEYMYGMMVLQMWISMFDPTQVLVDYLFERLLNQAVLGEFIEQYKDDHPGLVMNLSVFPSSLVANFMYKNLVEMLETQNISVTRENMLNKLETWTEDEKWQIESTSFLAARQYLAFIKNNNTIRYSGSPKISLRSEIKPITFEKARMVVQDGGSGLLELRKI